MIQLIIPQPKLHFLQPCEVFFRRSLPARPRAAVGTRRSLGLVSLSLSHSLLTECLFICRIPNTGSKCQHVNGYTTVQTALGHYEPKRHQNRNLEKRKEKQKNEGISHKKVHLCWRCHTRFPSLSFTFSWAIIGLDRYDFYAFIYIFIFI